MLAEGVPIAGILIYILSLNDDRSRVFIVRVRGRMREDVRGEADDVAQDSDRVVSLVGEDVDIAVAVTEEEVVLECAVDDGDLNDVGVRVFLDRHGASPEAGFHLSVFAWMDT